MSLFPVDPWKIMHMTDHCTLYIPYTYKFSKDINFEVSMVNWLFTKFASSKFYWHGFHLHRLDSRIHLNGNV